MAGEQVLDRDDVLRLASEALGLVLCGAMLWQMFVPAETKAVLRRPFDAYRARRVQEDHLRRRANLVAFETYLMHSSLREYERGQSSIETAIGCKQVGGGESR